MFFSRWLVAPFLFGLLCCLVLLIYRFFADLLELAIQLPSASWHDLVVGVLNLVDIALVANLVLIVVFSTYENYIRRIDSADNPDWPLGLTNVDFGALKQKLLGSIAGVKEANVTTTRNLTGELIVVVGVALPLAGTIIKEVGKIVREHQANVRAQKLKVGKGTMSFEGFSPDQISSIIDKLTGIDLVGPS